MQDCIYVPLLHTARVKYQTQANFSEIFVKTYCGLKRD